MRIKLDRNFDVVLPCDEGFPHEEQTLFHCELLSYDEEVKMATIASQQGLAAAGRLAIKASLKSVTRLLDLDGNPVEFKTATETPLGRRKLVPHDEFLDYIPTDQRLDLANKIMDANKLSEDDAKN